MNNYIECINKKLYKELKSLKKLTIEEINNFGYINYKLFLFLFYEYYDILNDYDNNLFNENNIIKILTSGNLKMLKYYESRGFTYELRDILFFTFCNKNIKILKYLLLKGADINNINYYGYRNAYILAAINNNIKLLKYLEENGININYCDKDCNMNAYLSCIYNAKLSTLKYLESRGIDIYKKNSSGRTAYIQAIITAKSIKILKHLESKGLNIYVKDNSNRNALKLALIYDNSKIVIKYLLQKFDSKCFNVYEKEQYKNILSHKNNSIKLIYI